MSATEQAQLLLNVARTIEGFLDVERIVSLTVRDSYLHENAERLPTVQVHVGSARDTDEIAAEWNLPEALEHEQLYTREGIAYTGVERHFLSVYSGRPAETEPEPLECQEHLTVTHDVDVSCFEALAEADR